MPLQRPEQRPEQRDEQIIRSLYGDPNDDIPYFAALGKFIVSYAAAETALHLLARKLSGMNEKKARIVFGGMGLGEIKEKVKKLLAMRRMKKNIYDMAINAIDQLNHIKEQRNKLVHERVSYHKGKLHVTDFYVAKSELQVKIKEFSLKELKDFESDCRTIHVRLEVIRRPQVLGNAVFENVKLLHSPWLYKPPQPSKKDQSRAGQQRSSPK